MKKKSNVSTSSHSINSVKRAIDVLKCFSVETPELGVTEIADRLGYTKSTVHRILTTYVNEGLAHQLDNGRYSLGWRAFAIGAAVREKGGVRQIILKSLRSLVEHTGETAHFAVLDRQEVLYIEKVESPLSLRMPSKVGMRVPLHSTALGKVLLAGLKDPEMLRIIYSIPLTPITQNTITDPDELRDEVLKAREQGHALDLQEIEIGLACVAAPLVDKGGITYGAISISGPLTRMEDNIDDLISAVMETSRILSQDLVDIVPLVVGTNSNAQLTDL